MLSWWAEVAKRAASIVHRPSSCPGWSSSFLTLTTPVDLDIIIPSDQFTGHENPHARILKRRQVNWIKPRQNLSFALCSWPRRERKENTTSTLSQGRMQCGLWQVLYRMVWVGRDFICNASLWSRLTWDRKGNVDNCLSIFKKDEAW